MTDDHTQEYQGATQRAAAENGQPYVGRNDDGGWDDFNADQFAAEQQAPDPEPLDPDEDWRNPRIVRRKDALEAREREAQGILMRLPYTGGFARVRILYIQDKSSLGWVPNHLQGVLARIINEVEGHKQNKVVSDTEAFTRAVKQVGDANALADAFCVRGFVDPTLVPHEKYLDPNRDDQMVVTDLHINERMGYFSKCMMTGQDVTLLDPFLGRPVDDVPGQPGNQAAAAPVAVSRVR